LVDLGARQSAAGRMGVDEVLPNVLFVSGPVAKALLAMAHHFAGAAESELIMNSARIVSHADLDVICREIGKLLDSDSA
jgi:hypothetical protein